jgi:alpha-amylase/alpha-mannosidase (GH57 family)
MDAKAGAADLHSRLRAIGERVQSKQPLTVCLFLDGENAWEYYPGNGREFLREFYGRIQADPDFRALTASEAIAAAGEISETQTIFPASWINANFDVWIGHAEDVQAWDLLWDAREAYARAEDAKAQDRTDAPNDDALKDAKESLLAAEGSDWCWWYGPEHSTANDAEFDALYANLTGIYRALQKSPTNSRSPSSASPSMPCICRLRVLRVDVNGRDTSYFEWLGAGLYSSERQRSDAWSHLLSPQLRYGFEVRLCIRLMIPTHWRNSKMPNSRDYSRQHRRNHDGQIVAR